MYTLIVTAKLNDLDPLASLADVLARIAELLRTRVHELLPWSWNAARDQSPAAYAVFHLMFGLRFSRIRGDEPHVLRYSPDGYAPAIA